MSVMRRSEGMGEPQFLDVGGVRTRFFAAGVGETVLLIGGGHFGSPYASTDWDLNFAHLAHTNRVVAVDKLGQGHTDLPASSEDYRIDAAVDHLIRFADELGMTTAHLVGHSRGGYAVCSIARQRPDLVRSVTVIDSGSLMHSHSSFYPQLEREMADIDDRRERYLYALGEQSFGDTIASDHWLDDLLSFADGENAVLAARTMKDVHHEFQAALTAGQETLRSWIRGGGLSSVPVLVVWGYNDRGAPFDECGLPALRLFFEGAPSAQMHIFNESGHFPYREHPEAFNELLTVFLGGAATHATP